MAPSHVHPPLSPISASHSQSLSSLHPDSALKRNIHNVILGDIRFPTWFWSPYPDDSRQDGDTGSGYASEDGLKVGKRSLGDGIGLVAKARASRVIDRERTPGRSKDKATETEEERTLYVCPWCFRYCGSWEGDEVEGGMAAHVKLCPLRTSPPGTKIYDHNHYEIWEVDGTDQKLFCQNLSLFGKLFLDNKSVFFDVSSFLYYLLVHRAPTPNTPSPSPKRASKASQRRDFAGTENGLQSDHTILGFFSKEMPSWENNNLACILIFPPYQHRSLGKLLMGISYSLQDLEAVGGPEKPLSELGRRGYQRFWVERVSRYIMNYPGIDDDGEATRKPGKRKRGREDVMTVGHISKGTGMVIEDVVYALTTMGVVDDEIPSPKKKKKSQSDADDTKEKETATLPKVNGETSTHTNPAPSEWHPHSHEDEDQPAALARNVRIRKSKVREWVEANRVDLTDPVDSECFLGDYQWVEISTESAD